jgi:phytoene dehydrogenase-like protein
MKEISLDRVDESDYDVVIAGSGAGGLLTALGLSEDGKRVLVLEKENRLGGVWYGYNVGGYRVDQGLHVITRAKRGPFSRFLRKYLRPAPEIVMHDGWYFRVNDKVGTIPSSIAQGLRWPLTGMGGRLSLIRIGARIKMMKLREMRMYRHLTFLDYLQMKGVTNQTIIDVLQSALYMAAGVPIEQASAYEALRTLKDTDKETPKGESLKNLLIGSQEFDEGVAIGGMQGLVGRVVSAINGDYVLNAPVTQIAERENKVAAVTVHGREIRHSKVVSDIPLWSLSEIVESRRNEVTSFFEKWSHMRPTKGLTLWLGLDKVVVGDRKSRVIVHPLPSRWMLSLSSFDPSCAPEGKELVGIAMIFIEGRSVDEQVRMMKGNGLTKYHPGIVDHIEMEHVQVSYATRAALMPGQTALDRPGPRTPVRGLYIVGTDTAGEGVGLQQAANSAEGALAAIRSDW